MRQGYLLAGLLAAALVAGCAKKLDGSSTAAFQASVEKVSKSLPDEKRQKFVGALMVVAMSNVDVGAIMSGKGTSDQFQQKTIDELNGLTADEVIAKAKAITDKRDAAEREQAIGEIKELMQKKTDAEAAKTKLSTFQVLRSRYSEKGGYFGTDPSIEMTVKNLTGHAISRAYFHAILASPGRAVPWKAADFNYEIPGGIENGEQKDWSLEPGYDWRNIGAPADAIITIQAIRLDGPDGNALYDAQFDEDDAKRLKELKAKFGG